MFIRKHFKQVRTAPAQWQSLDMQTLKPRGLRQQVLGTGCQAGCAHPQSSVLLVEQVLSTQSLAQAHQSPVEADLRITAVQREALSGDR